MACSSGKLSYANELFARTALYMAMNCRANGEVKPVRTYKCEECGRWHLTHVPLIVGKTAVLTPAYGRNYCTSNAAVKDFNSGKDWILNDPTTMDKGAYCSKRDIFNNIEYDRVELRYNRNRDSVLLTVLRFDHESGQP